MPVQERRRAPRLKIKLNVDLRMPGRQVARLGDSIDISRNGAYLCTEYFMAEGTRLPVTVHLPEDKGSPSSEIHPDGIVVRCVPEVEDPAVKEYEVAIFFMDVDEDEQELLNAFLERRLAQGQAN